MTAYRKETTTNYYVVTTTMIKWSIPIRLRELKHLKSVAEHALKKEKQKASNLLFDERWNSPLWKLKAGWFVSEGDLREWADANPQEVLGMFDGWRCEDVVRGIKTTEERLNVLMRNAESHHDRNPVEVHLSQKSHLIVFTTYTTDWVMEKLKGYLPVEMAP